MTIAFSHEIAGIKFLTESDFNIALLQTECFKQFQRNNNRIKHDVYQRIINIDSDTLTLPPIDDVKKAEVSRCISLPLSRGSFIIPPLLSRDWDNFQNSYIIGDRLDVPLLKSRLVRTRLEACLEDANQTGLALHEFFVIIQDHTQSKTEIFFSSDHREIFSSPYLYNGFRRLFTTFLPNFSAVMLHSSSLIRDGKAAIFLAPDEGGKNTVIKQSPMGVVLSDDRNIIRAKGGSFYVYGTPWGSIFNSSDFARIGGIFLLEKASNFEILPIKPRVVIQFLWNDNFSNWHSLPKHLKIKAFEILNSVCHQIPVYLMRFPKNYVNWDTIDAAMV